VTASWLRPIDVVLAVAIGFTAFVFSATFLTLSPSLIVWACVVSGYLLARWLAVRRRGPASQETEK